MAFFRASIFNSVSFPSRASLISLARAGVPLSKWTRRVHDFSIGDPKLGLDLGGSESGKVGSESEKCGGGGGGDLGVCLDGEWWGIRCFEFGVLVVAWIGSDRRLTRESEVRESARGTVGLGRWRMGLGCVGLS